MWTGSSISVNSVCVIEKKAVLNCCLWQLMRLPIVRSDSVIHQHVGRTVGGALWMVVRKCRTGV